MHQERREAEGRSSGGKAPYDLTEEASKSGVDEVAAGKGRKAESDDATEETALGFVSGPEGDTAGENRVTTSLSDD